MGPRVIDKFHVDIFAEVQRSNNRKAWSFIEFLGAMLFSSIMKRLLKRKITLINTDLQVRQNGFKGPNQRKARPETVILNDSGLHIPKETVSKWHFVGNENRIIKGQIHNGIGFTISIKNGSNYQTDLKLYLYQKCVFFLKSHFV